MQHHLRGHEKALPRKAAARGFCAIQNRLIRRPAKIIVLSKAKVIASDQADFVILLRRFNTACDGLGKERVIMAQQAQICGFRRGQREGCVPIVNLAERCGIAMNQQWHALTLKGLDNIRGCIGRGIIQHNMHKIGIGLGLDAFEGLRQIVHALKHGRDDGNERRLRHGNFIRSAGVGGV